MKAEAIRRAILHLRFLFPELLDVAFRVKAIVPFRPFEPEAPVFLVQSFLQISEDRMLVLPADEIAPFAVFPIDVAILDPGIR